MDSGVSISVIISTRDRASSLRETLETLGKIRVPAGNRMELIVVDNGSTDETAQVIRSAKTDNLKVEYLYEGSQGKSNGLNAALRQARGEIILFTDDDVVVPEDWAEQMIAALTESGTDAVVGRVVLADELARPWLTPLHKWWLAAPDEQWDETVELIGANMGFRRSVLEHVPGFDPGLGPGKLGFGEETLFGKQLMEAGFKIRYAPRAVIVHRPENSRLRRRDWLETARKKGRQAAYLCYHWEHNDIRAPRIRWFQYLIKLHIRRIIERPPCLDCEGISTWEMNYVQHMETCRGLCVERRRPRNYARRGLEKRRVTADLKNDYGRSIEEDREFLPQPAQNSKLGGPNGADAQTQLDGNR
jgi:glucosyl-dolichyl phosphate glucuronosyltransferase